MATVTGPDVEVTHELAAQTYRETRERMIAVARAVGDERGRAEFCPACPEWSWADVMAHMAGVADDILNQNMEGVTTDPWTQAQIDKRASASMTEICDEWEAHGAELDPLIAMVGADIDPRFLFDQWTHEQDLRPATGEPGGQESWALSRILRFGLENVTERLDEQGAPAIELVIDGPGGSRWHGVGGVGEPAGSLHLSAFEFFRFASGRRSEAQARAYDWPGDPTPWLASMPIWGLADTDITDAQ